MFAIPLFAVIGKYINAPWWYWLCFAGFCIVEILCRIEIQFGDDSDGGDIT